MAKIATEIKNTFQSHLSRGLFGMEIYGQFRIEMFDKRPRVAILQVRGASRFERYGLMTIYHPIFGKWQASLLSEHHCGAPRQVLDTDAIRANLEQQGSLMPELFEVYEVAPREFTPARGRD